MAINPQRTKSAWRQDDAWAAELAECEAALNTCRTLRLSAVVAAPLAAALCVPAGWATRVCWMLALWLFIPLLRGWGYSYLAVFTTVLSWYLLLAFKTTSAWALLTAGTVTLVMVRYLWDRLQRIESYRLSMGSDTGCSREEGKVYRVLF